MELQKITVPDYRPVCFLSTNIYIQVHQINICIHDELTKVN